MDGSARGIGVDDSGGPQDCPRGDYQRRLQARRTTAAREENRQRITGNARVAVVLLAGALCYPILLVGQLGAAWLVLPVVLFVAVSIMHDRVTRAWVRAKRAVE